MTLNQSRQQHRQYASCAAQLSIPSAGICQLCTCVLADVYAALLHVSAQRGLVVAA